MSRKVLSVLLSLFLIHSNAQVVLADGIASMNVVDASNHDSLNYHKISVKIDSNEIRSVVMIDVLVEKPYRLAACEVTISSAGNEKPPAMIAAFSMDPSSRPMSFSIANGLVDGTSIRYHIISQEGKLHVFDIQPGQLRKLAELDKRIR